MYYEKVRKKILIEFEHVTIQIDFPSNSKIDAVQRYEFRKRQVWQHSAEFSPGFPTN